MSKGSQPNPQAPLFQNDEEGSTDRASAPETLPVKPIPCGMSHGARSDDDVEYGKGRHKFRADGQAHSEGEGPLSPASEERDGREEASVGAPVPASAVEGAAPVSPSGESLGGGGGASSRVPVENSSVSHRWCNPKSPVFRIVAPPGLAAIIVGAYLARRHVKKQRALGKPTVFNRMGQWVQQRYRGLVRSPKKPAGEDGRREKTTSETSA